MERDAPGTARERLPPAAFAAYCAGRAPRRSGLSEEVVEMSRMLALACALAAFAMVAGSASSRH
jgi:hypothetical protein